ncbi:hypothetical protein D4Q85_00910 [bacterium]|nr:MAG: hypothetical protein D4Q85_00910 [bacterium]
MYTRPLASRSFFLAPVLALCVLASATYAQPGNKKKLEEPPLPPTITRDKEGSSPVIPYILAFLTIGLVVGVTTIPSRRGHQD